MESLIRSLSRQEQLNFLLTNRIPRHLLTRVMGWYSRIESPWLTRLSLALWRLFADDLRLEEAKEQRFTSLRACFIRELKPGVRPIDRSGNAVVSPCDAIVGAYGRIEGDTVFQAKGFPYLLSELIPDTRIAQKYRNGSFVTLRLKSSMYHRFHAPIDGEVKEILYISGDTWNVNPIALKRIEKLFCKNERAVVEFTNGKAGSGITLVPVAAILVASMQFHCLDFPLDLQYQGPNRFPCRVNYKKGDELGYFQHGSTIIMLATENYSICNNIQPQEAIQMGQRLLIE